MDPETSSHHPPLNNKNVKSTIATILGILVLTIGAGIGVFLVQNQQIFNERAAGPDTTGAKIAEIARQIGQNSNTTSSTYGSKNLGYQLNFDKNYWMPASSTNLNQPDLSKLTFSLNNEAGLAQVTFETRTLSAGLKSAGSGTDTLDSLAASIASQTNPVSKERIRRNGRDYYKLTYNLTFINQKSQYYQYLTINGDNYYVITAKYPTFGNGQTLSDELIDSFSFTPQSPNVKAASTDSIPSSALDESKIVELTKPSVFQIAHLYCNDINVPNLSGTKYLKSSYTFCDGALGSGFAINQDGSIATNGHVVKNYPEMALIEALAFGSQSIKPFALDLVQEIVFQQTGQDISSDQAQALLIQALTDPTAFQSFVTLIYKLMQQNLLTLKENQNKYFVKLANDPMVIDTSKTGKDILNAIAPSNTIKEASFVASNFPNAYSVDAVLNNKPATGSDVAIIKITDPAGLVFPSLKLGDTSNLKEGSDVIVIGYPGIVSGSNSPDSLLNQKSSAEATVTRGIISAIKNDQGGLKLIQVDASIDHGNSGGPAFDNQGNVIGIATYGLGSQSGNYNFLRDINDLEKLASDNSISTSTSPTYDEWAQGLNYFWIQHFRQAEIPFGQVEKDYPIHPSVENYISDSQTAIQKGQDKSGFVFLLLNDRTTQIEVAGGVLIFAAVIFGVMIFIKKKGGNNMPTQMPPPQYPQPVPTQSYPIPQPTQPYVSQVAPPPPPISNPQVFSTNGPLSNNV